MDLIAEIIKRKNTNINVEEAVKNILNECIFYEKLSKNQKFKDIHHPVTKAKCPTLYAIATDNKAVERHVWRSIKPLLQEFLEHADILPKLIDEEEYQSTDKREKILNKIYRVNLYVYHLSELDKRPESFIAITHKIGQRDRCLLISFDNEKLNVYIGDYDETQRVQYEVEPIIVRKQDAEIVLESWSSMGNNDYVFATINQLPARIRNNQLIVDGKIVAHLNNDFVLMTDEKEIATHLLERYIEWKEEQV